nr:SREBP regulating gene protein isoform X12 [Kogia breviceps]
MVNLAAMVWRRLLRKRWVLALVFGLSLVYFLTSTFKQEERAVRDRNLLQIQDHDQPIPWKVQFNLGNSSRPSNQCRNSIQGKHLITDELGYVCERKDLLVNGCCNVNVPGTKQYCCDGCLSNGCCSAYEYCVSCCLQPNKQLLLERFLNRAAVAFQNLFMAVEDHFELCLAKCRTSSQAMPKQTASYCPCCSRHRPKAKDLPTTLLSESEAFCMAGVSNHLQILLTKHKAAPGGWAFPYLEMVRAVPTGTLWFPSRQEELAGKRDSLQRVVKVPKELCAPATSPFQPEPGFFFNKKLPVIAHSEATPNPPIHLAGHL